MSEEIDSKNTENSDENILNYDNLILVMGLDDSGKTSLFNHFFDGILFHPLPTELLEERKREFYGLNLVFREIGGRYRFRPEWYENTKDAKGIIWILDSIDRGRKTEAKEELDALLKQEHLSNIPLLFVANKQESKYAMPWEEIENKFNFDDLRKERKLNIIRTTQYTCEHLTEGLLWLVEEIGLEPVFEDRDADDDDGEKKNENEVPIAE